MKNWVISEIRLEATYMGQPEVNSVKLSCRAATLEEKEYSSSGPVKEKRFKPESLSVSCIDDLTALRSITWTPNSIFFVDATGEKKAFSVFSTEIVGTDTVKFSISQELKT
jgi:hypothetical protein